MVGSWDGADLWGILCTAFKNVTNSVAFNDFLFLVLLMHLDTFARKGIVRIIVITIFTIIFSSALYKSSDSRVPFSLYFASYQHLKYVLALSTIVHVFPSNKLKMNYELLIHAVSHVIISPLALDLLIHCKENGVS